MRPITDSGIPSVSPAVDKVTVENASVFLVRFHPKGVLLTSFAGERISNHTVISNGLCQLT